MAYKKVLIDFFYDIISPYSYLAFEVLQRYKTLWKIDLKLKPILLYGVMKESGNSNPAVIPNKKIYIEEDLKRLQKYFQVPVSPPSNIMEIIRRVGSKNAMRFITSVDLVEPKYLEGVSQTLWDYLYKYHKDIEKLETLKEAGLSLKMDPKILEQCLNSINEPHVKDRLGKYTDEALELGAFGAPLIVAYVNGKPEEFFGSDRFELLAHILGEKWLGPVPYSIPPSKL